jgi:hypothetical protein
LKGQGADYAIALPGLVGGLLPEQFRYMTADSITATVTTADYNDSNFGF